MRNRELKPWALVLILALGISAAGAQTTQISGTATNLGPGTRGAPSAPSMIETNPINPTIQQSNNPISGAPSTAVTNPLFGNGFRSNMGFQTATNFAFTGIPEGGLGVPSMTETNPFFANAFHNNIGSQIATTTNFTFAGIPQTRLAAPSVIPTNPFFANTFHTNVGSQVAAPTNFASAGVPQTNLGVPSTPSTASFATNLTFGNSSNAGSQTGTPTNFFPPITGPSGGGPFTTTTNPFFAPTNPLAATNPFVGTLTNPGSAGAGRGLIGAQAGMTNFLFVSSTQSSIGQGRSLFSASTNGLNVRLTQNSSNSLQFSISTTNRGATNWLLEFSTTNDFFTPGIYSNAVLAGGSPASLMFGGMGRGDTTSDGAFKVLEATYSSNQIVSFAADFIQFDNGDTNSWNEGSIRYNSTIPETRSILMAPVAVSFQKGITVLTWSTNLVGFKLEYSTNLSANMWFTNSSVPKIVDGQYTVTNGISAGTGARLYRLVKAL